MVRFKLALILLFVVVLAPLVFSEDKTSSSFASAPVEPSIVDIKRMAILDYISKLSNATTFQGVISGQNCYHGNEIADNGRTVQDPGNPWENQNGYTRLVEALHTQTGKWVGILGVDYEFQKIFTPAELSRANEILIKYAQKNGIIAVTFTPQNPWLNDETDLSGNPGSWNGPAGSQNKAGFSKVRLDDLFDPTKPVNAAWMRKLDRIGGALQELKDAGVIVLFRPMQEMNGDWFWWGTSSHSSDPAPYIRVYKKMKDYFTNTLKLNNLIWVYSPASTQGSTWVKPVGWAYPGAEAVDIVAGTEYNDAMKIWDYQAYLRLKKPLGMGEFCPADNGAAKNGSWDMSKLSKTIKENYPRIAFWISWHHFSTLQWDIFSNKNSAILMQDPLVRTRDDFGDWSAIQNSTALTN